jgi:hypothetical protein
MKKKIFSIVTILFTVYTIVYSTNNVPESPYHAKKAATAPIIDGLPTDSCWSLVDWAPIDQVWLGSPTTADDFTGSYKVVWTSDRLYVLMKFIRKMINDHYPANNMGDIYDYDCAEIFIDEDHSGGSYNTANPSNCYNAFSYHMTDRDSVYDFGANAQGWYCFNKDIKLVVDSSAGNHTYYWEVEMKVFGNNYVFNGNNTPITLTSGKILGFSTAYNTNDGGTTRKNMFGSHYIAGSNKNISWDNASALGELILDDNTVSTIKINSSSVNNFNCYPNPTMGLLHISLSSTTQGKVKIELYDIIGKVIESIDAENKGGVFNSTLDLSKIKQGIYFIRVTNNQKDYLQKIILQ